MRKVIELLSNINFWTIVGVIVSIATVAVVIKQHRHIDVVLSLHAQKDTEIAANQQLCFVLLATDKVPKTVQKVKFPVPIGFYNPNKEAINMEVSIKTTDLGCSLAFGEYMPLKVLRNSGSKIDAYFLYEMAQLRRSDSIDSQVYILWSYENMSNQASARMNIKCFTDVKKWLDSNELKDMSVVYVPDFENSTSEEFLYKILDPKMLNELVEQYNL